MFFPKNIISIKPTDKVLEVGPGGSPHPRSDVLLELSYDNEEAAEQRGHTDKLKTNKKIVYYTGSSFPFKDNDFDYVICSHVLEHIMSLKLQSFISELQRVARKGYIEYPTVYYEYLYNFNVHKTILNNKNGVLYYIGKEHTSLSEFSSVQVFFYKTLQNGYDEVIRKNKGYFVQGFEWFDKIEIQKTRNLQDLVAQNISLVNVKLDLKGYYLRNILAKFRRVFFW